MLKNLDSNLISSAFLQALNAAAARLQTNISSEQAVFDTFANELKTLDLNGGVFMRSMTSPDVLETKVLFFTHNLIKRLEKLTNSRSKGYKISLKNAAFFHWIAEHGEALVYDQAHEHLPEYLDTNIEELLPVLKKIIPNVPIMNLPIRVDDQLAGVLLITDKELTCDHIPPLTALSNHLAIALQNTRLINRLQTKEKEYRDLVQYAEESIVVFDVEQERIISANERAHTSLGFSEEELLQMSPVDFAPATQPGGIATRDFLQAQMTLALQGERSTFEWVFTNKRKEERLCEVRLVRLPEPGRKLVRASIVDITNRKNKEEQFELQATALRRAANAICITDKDGVIEWANPAFCNLSGYSIEELTGTNPNILKSGHTTQEDYKLLWDTILGNQTWHGELTNKRKDGSYYVVDQTITPVVTEDGEISHFIAIAQDITKRKQHELELNSLLVISQYLRAAKDVDESIPSILGQMQSLSNLDGIMLMFTDPSSGDHRIKFSRGLGENLEGSLIPAGAGITSRVLEEGKAYINNDYQNNPDPDAFHPDLVAGLQALACIPLTSHENKIGALWVGRSKPFSDSEVSFLTTACDMLATAFHRLELIRESKMLLKDSRTISDELANRVVELEELRRNLEQSNFELERLYNAAETLLTSSTPSLQHTADRIVRTVLKEFGKSNCSLILLDYDKEELQRIAAAGPYADEVKQSVLLRKGVGIVPQAIREERIINVGDVTLDTNYVPNWKDARAEIAIPLKVGTRLLGVLDIQSTRENAFSKEDERLLSIYAERAAITLENALLFDEAQTQLSQLKSLRNIDIAITSSLDQRLTLNILVDQIASQSKADAISILIANPDHTLNVAAQRGFQRLDSNQTNLQFGVGLAGVIALQRKPLLYGDIREASIPIESQRFLEREEFKAYFGFPLIAKGELVGVLEVFKRTEFQPPRNWLNFLEALAEQTAIAINNTTLFEGLKTAKAELELAYNNTLQGWVRALDLRDKETEGHTQRVTQLATQMARLMKFPEDEIVHITRGAMLHDIGKVGIPDSILLKEGTFTPEERAIMEKHTDYARDFLKDIPYLRPAMAIPYCHHERWDGSGYPQGVKGEAIPLEARMFAIVDVWDALNSDRPYRKAWPKKKIISHIKEGSGKHFDPQIVDIFLTQVLPTLQD